MKIEDLTFDNFMSLPSLERRLVINEPDLLQVMVKKNLHEHRYAHSVSVAECASRLAET